jgi:hypothetical protein
LEELSSNKTGFPEFFCHAPAGIEYKSYSDGIVFHGEGHDGLLDFFVKHMEIGLFQTGDRTIQQVADLNGNKHKIGVGPKIGPRKIRLVGVLLRAGLLTRLDRYLPYQHAHR